MTPIDVGCASVTWHVSFEPVLYGRQSYDDVDGALPTLTYRSASPVPVIANWYVPAASVGVVNVFFALRASEPLSLRPFHGCGAPPPPGVNVLSCSPVTITSCEPSIFAKICS